MVIVIFGENCTGKSTVAEALANKAPAKVFSGKDYLRLAKNEAMAETLFMKLLSAHTQDNEHVIYVVSEKEHLRLVPKDAVRVLVTADLDVIKKRFSERMRGSLPAPVSAMLEKKHGSFDAEPCDIHIVDGEKPLERVCEEIFTYHAS